MVDQEIKKKTGKIRKKYSHDASPSPASTRAFAFASISCATQHVPQPGFSFCFVLFFLVMPFCKRRGTESVSRLECHHC